MGAWASTDEDSRMFETVQAVAGIGGTPVAGMRGVFVDGYSEGPPAPVELVLNGDFSASPGGWSLSSPATIVDGVLVFDGENVGQASRTDPVEPITAGDYTYAFDLVATNGESEVTVYVGTTFPGLTVSGSTVPGHYSGTITTIASSQTLRLRVPSGAVCQIDNFSVKRAP
jgi:hypothetical protein